MVFLHFGILAHRQQTGGHINYGAHQKLQTENAPKIISEILENIKIIAHKESLEIGMKQRQKSVENQDHDNHGD